VQTLFNEGEQQLFGFNVVEARRNFEAAVTIDPVSKMALKIHNIVLNWG
jgi:Holliday junction resolvasome RuvABC DNA-binding subunit